MAKNLFSDCKITDKYTNTTTNNAILSFIYAKITLYNQTVLFLYHIVSTVITVAYNMNILMVLKNQIVVIMGVIMIK